MNRYGRIELYTAIASAVLAVVAGAYLVITTFAENETCYGISGVKIECHTINTSNAAATVGRLVTVLSMVLVLYAFGALAALWQGHTRQSDARVTAYMALVTCSLTVLAMTWAALYGVGFFFLPSTMLIVIATISGLIALLQAPKDAANVDQLADRRHGGNGRRAG
ncbi:MAG: hypothetical protein ACLQUY_27105 [Ktedonobacterales bacterium]